VRLSESGTIVSPSFTEQVRFFDIVCSGMRKVISKPWTVYDVSALRELAEKGTPARMIAVKLGRTLGAVQARAQPSAFPAKVAAFTQFNKVTSPHASSFGALVARSQIAVRRRPAKSPYTKSTMIAPTTAPISPAPSPGRYHPRAWPK